MDGKVLSGPFPVCNVPVVPMGKRQVYNAHKCATVIGGKVVTANVWVLKGGEMPGAAHAVTEAMFHGLHEVSDYPMQGVAGGI